MGGSAPTGALWNARILVAFTIAAYALYYPALGGAFVSDDAHYVQANPYVHELSAEHVVAILDPFGPLPRIVENYAPVHLLLHGIAWQAFGSDVRGHHAVNVALHAIAAFLLVALLRRTGVPPVAGALGGAFFLAHPANVEAVAWINQLKTTSAMILCLSALLLHPRRPLGAALAFALALLAKPTAAAGLFAVAAFGRSRPQPVAPSMQTASDAPVDWRWPWIAAWAVAFAAFAVVELAAFEQTAGRHAAPYPELAVRLRTVFAVALRYLVMATTSFGLSVFQEPDPAASPLDPWWLASLPVLALLGWRTLATWRARRVEAAWWIFAAASFAPVCGLVPLPHPIADRYLYFMLPGLIGGALLAGADAVRRVSSARGRAVAAGVGVAIGLAWIAVFALRSYDRAFVWRSERTVIADVVAHYPNGRWALVERAARAAAEGDADRAVSDLRAARERGFEKLEVLLGPRYAPLATHPGFVALERELAELWVARIDELPEPSQSDLMFRAQAWIVLGELDAARADLRRAIYVGGPRTDYLYGALDQLDALERERATDGSGGS